MCLQVGHGFRLEFKTVLVNLWSFLQQEMQSNKYKNKAEIIHCYKQKSGWAAMLQRRMWAWRGFQPKHSSWWCALEQLRHEAIPHRRSKSSLGYCLHASTVCCLRLQNLGARTHFFLYCWICTWHSAMGSLLKLRYSISDDNDDDVYCFHSPSKRAKRWWGLSYKWEPQVERVGATGQVTPLSPSPCRARSSSHTRARTKLSAHHPNYCCRDTSACFPKH